jgi:glycosyltransferase involved in cell wall biosynthesis
MTGTGVSFEIFCTELGRALPDVPLDVIDTSPKKLKRHFRSVSVSTLMRAVRITGAFLRRVTRVDRVLIFGTDGFLLTMAPVLVVIAKLTGRPVHLRVFGGSFDTFYRDLRPWTRLILDRTLTGAEGLSVQTKLLRDAFRPALGDRVTMSPGYRYLAAGAPRQHRSSIERRDTLRVLYVGLIFEDKGVFELLESIRRLSAEQRFSVQCDLYGKIYPFAEARFEAELSRTENAAYRGVLEPGAVIDTMSQYDALVFPTLYPGEGHPGVIVESMMAGIPVVTTDFRSIPELVKDRFNGLLVPPRDPAAIEEALITLHSDRRLLTEMGQHNWECRTRHDARQVVPNLARQMGVPIYTAPPPGHTPTARSSSSP